MLNKKSILKFFILSLLLIPASCKTNAEIKPLDDKIAQPQEAPNETPKPYEVIASEQQAQKIDENFNDNQQEIEVQDRVFFANDSSELSDEAKQILNLQSAWLREDKSINITIEGHCDERGTREYNIALGEKRAFAVKKYLKNAGIADGRIKIISYGKERPVYFGNSDESHAKNRRAVTIVN